MPHNLSRMYSKNECRLFCTAKSIKWRMKMKKRLIYAFCLSVCLSLACAPFAQAADPQKPSGPPKYFAKNASVEYKQKMDVASAKLKKMEVRLNKIEKNRVFSKDDADSMNMELDQYGNGMWNLYNEAVGKVKEANETKGQKGGNEEFLYFEDIAQGHVKRMKVLEAKHQKIENDIKNGKIKPEKDIIDTMTPQEKNEFKRSLTPEGRKEIEKAYPKMVGSSMSFPSTQELAFTRFNDLCSDCSSTITNFFVSSAEASCAYGCYVICAATFGTGCVFCVLGTGVTAVNAYKSWSSCMSSCSCHWYRFWCCAKKTGCTTLFLATLA